MKRILRWLRENDEIPSFPLWLKFWTFQTRKTRYIEVDLLMEIEVHICKTRLEFRGRARNSITVPFYRSLSAIDQLLAFDCVTKRCFASDALRSLPFETVNTKKKIRFHYKRERSSIFALFVGECTNHAGFVQIL